MSGKLESRLFGELQRHAGPDLEVLTEPTDPRFQELAKRWSDIDRQIPAAIVLPESEEQIQKTVSDHAFGDMESLSQLTLLAASGPLGCSNFSAVRHQVRWPQYLVDNRK